MFKDYKHADITVSALSIDVQLDGHAGTLTHACSTGCTIQQLLFTSCTNAFYSADFIVCTLSAVPALVTQSIAAESAVQMHHAMQLPLECKQWVHADQYCCCHLSALATSFCIPSSAGYTAIAAI